jgi:hypothetical protein
MDRRALKEKKFKVCVGDTIYYESINGIEQSIAMIVDGQDIVTPDLGHISKKKCLPECDPRVIDYLKSKKF